MLCPERQHQFPSYKVTHRVRSSFLFCVDVPYSLLGSRKMRAAGLGSLSLGYHYAFGNLLCFSTCVGGRHPPSNQAQKVLQLPGVIPPSAKMSGSFFFFVDLLRSTGQDLGSVKRILADLLPTYRSWEQSFGAVPQICPSSPDSPCLDPL